jgi:drug/metabolite transporter (DMT)-like permease
MNLLIFSMVISILWGIQPILYKMLLNKTDLKLFFVTVNYTLLIGVIIYTIYYWKDINDAYQKINVSELYKIGLIALISSFIPNLIYYNLLNYHQSHLVSALSSCGPIFTVLISFFILKENINKMDLFAVSFIIAGIFLLSYNNH